MPRTVWLKIAKVLKEKYVEDNKCTLCGSEIELDENILKQLRNIYRHFKEAHPEKIEEAKQELVQEAVE